MCNMCFSWAHMHMVAAASSYRANLCSMHIETPTSHHLPMVSGRWCSSARRLGSSVCSWLRAADVRGSTTDEQDYPWAAGRRSAVHISLHCPHQSSGVHVVWPQNSLWRSVCKHIVFEICSTLACSSKWPPYFDVPQVNLM